MSVEAIAATVPQTLQIQEPLLLPQVNLQALQGATGASASQDGFGSLVVQGLQQLNRQLVGAEIDKQQLAVGNIENLHQIMIRLEESKLAFNLAMQFRNRLLEAYQDVMKMQI